MADKVKAIKAKLRLLAKALIPRLLFILHGLICVDLIVWSERDARYWYLLICLGLIVIEGLFNVIVRNGKEFHWFCPSAFLYCIVLIIPLTALRLTQMNSLLGKGQIRDFNTSDHTDHFTTDFLFREKKYGSRISFIEQTGMGFLIIGRWALPKGSISKEQFLQIVLIYIGTAADILELSEIYDEDIASMKPHMIQGVYYGTISVWALSISQFSMTIALPEKGLKYEEFVDSVHGVKPTSYFSIKSPNKVAPITYNHYKSILKERTQNRASNAFSFRPSRQGSSLGDIHSPNANPNPNLLKVASQNALTLRQSSSSLPSIEDSKVSRNNSARHSEGNFRSALKKKKSISSSESFDIKLSKDEDSDVKELPTKYSSESARSKENNIRMSFKTNSPIRPLNNISRNGSTVGTKNFWREALNQYSNSKQKTTRKRRDSETEGYDVGVGKKEIQTCFEKYFDMIEMLHPVLMQDGPCFILRLVLLIHLKVSTDMTFLLLGKNFLVIIVCIYRTLLIFCAEPKESEDDDDASNRLRVAMDSNRRFSEKNALKSRQEYLSMYVLNTMQSEANNNRMKNISDFSRR